MIRELGRFSKLNVRQYDTLPWLQLLQDVRQRTGLGSPGRGGRRRRRHRPVSMARSLPAAAVACDHTAVHLELQPNPSTGAEVEAGARTRPKRR